jgi:sulfoquinovosyltransferase
LSLSIPHASMQVSTKEPAKLKLLVMVMILSFSIAHASMQVSTSKEPAKLKVLVMVEPSPLTYVSGYANRFKELLRHLASNDDEFEVITTEVVAENKPDSWLGFPVHHTRGLRLPHYPLMSISCDWTLKALRVIQRMKPDIIHVSSPGFMVFAAIFYSRLFQIPLVASYHTHLPVYVRSYLPRAMYLSFIAERLTWLIIRILHWFVDLTVVTSPQIHAEFVEHGVGSCQVWPKGICTSRFGPKYKSAVMRKRMTNGHPNDFLVVYIGRLGKEKRLKELRDILERMPSNSRLCIVGSGPEELELQEHFNNTRTVFTGLLSGDELSAAYASADVFCMTSDSETLGFSVLESMASGVPVVGANAGGIPDIIQHEKTGFLVNTSDIDTYVDRLLLLQRDEQLRVAMGNRARQEMQKFSWQTSMTHLRDDAYKVARENYHKRFEQRLWRLLTFFKN